jgi:hypothetical protein
MREVHRHRLAIVRITVRHRKDGTTAFSVLCYDCEPSSVGTVSTKEQADILREAHRATVHPNGMESHRAHELALEYHSALKRRK